MERYVVIWTECPYLYGNVIKTQSDLLVLISHSVGECRLIEVCSVVIGL